MNKSDRKLLRKLRKRPLDDEFSPTQLARYNDLANIAAIELTKSKGSKGTGSKPASKKQKVEILIKEDGKFLDISGVPAQLKLRCGLKNCLFMRDCYVEFIADILASLPMRVRKTVAVLGTAGIGKSSLFLVLLKMLLDDPTKLGLATRSFYYQTLPGEIWLYRHARANKFSAHFVDKGELLDATIPLFADMECEGSPKEHAGVELIFTSFRPSRFRELTKNGWHKVMPTWSASEQAEYFASDHFQREYGNEVAERAYDNIRFFGGSIRKNIEAAVIGESPVEEIDAAILEKGEAICDRFFKAGFGGLEDNVSDVLVHRNPKIVGGKYMYHAKPWEFSFASPYVLRRLLQLKDNMLVTQARNKYSTGTFRGGDDGNEFEMLCLHGFKISDVEFTAQPLTQGAKETTVRFPAKQVLALNWREQEDYLKADVLYIPPYGNLESGDSFCLININNRWTLVILQCTIAATHPVKQNGMKVILECYKKDTKLKIDDTVIMFMIPVNGKLCAQQSLVTQKNEAVLRATIEVAAQYKIENALVTIDDN